MLLDFFCIFSTGGLILWYKQFINSKLEGLINYLIKTVLLDQKRNVDTLTFNGVVLRWKISDDKGLIFVSGYQESYPILYVENLISMVMNDFIKKEYDTLKIKEGLYLECVDYTPKFMQILAAWEKDCSKIMEGGENTKKAKEIFKKASKKEDKKKESKKNNEETLDDINETEVSRNKSSDPSNKQSQTVSLNSNIPRNIQLKKSRSSKDATKAETKEDVNKKPPPKQKTQKNSFGVYNEKDAKELDL